ncbi:hypothetical protein EDF56_101173 [Novosphingobium sp. PhB165]|uniref:carph-isopro domain-containing protein n=1 Tax=Novosphingobium sp. PhB165 TaxID=2485105 RepID=UPI0010E181CD|nr:hypothetical protein [Novosphingobium sp. PhB165]TCM21509.1 hypothetical protein EDF56_101173 [Novosphingobium sp. PhB165]
MRMDHQTIITDLGGIRALARKLGHNSHTTVQAWFDRNRIPLDRWEEVLGAAKNEGSALSVSDLLPQELRDAAA